MKKIGFEVSWKPPTKREQIARLSEVPLLNALSTRSLTMILELSEVRSFRSGAEIVTQGKPGRDFFILESGMASVIKNGRKIATFGAGDHFGEMALLDKAPRSATVRADTDVTVRAISQWAFLGLLGRMPDLAIKILQETARRLRQSDPASAD